MRANTGDGGPGGLPPARDERDFQGDFWLVAVSRLRALVMPEIQVAIAACEPDGPSGKRGLEAWDVIERTTVILRSVVREPAPERERPVSPAGRRAALTLLLEMEGPLRSTLPHATRVMVRSAVIPPDTSPDARDLWLSSRALLLDNGFLTPGELRTFPLASLEAIALQRLRRWEATGDARS